MILTYSPLEQFSILKLVHLNIGCLDISFTNSSLLALFSCFLPFLLLHFCCYRASLVPTFLQSMFEFLYEFLFYTILTENVKRHGGYYFPILFCIFTYIFVCNLFGMIPYSFTVTSHIVVTLGFSILGFFGINVIAIQTHGFHFLSFFLPSGAPLALAPLLVIIEFVSYCFRVISLALRLFANMMSGHCLLKILAGFSWSMLSAGGLLSFLHILPLLVIFFIIGLELAIAFLQAYVFSVLFCIYLNDAICLH